MSAIKKFISKFFRQKPIPTFIQFSDEEYQEFLSEREL